MNNSTEEIEKQTESLLNKFNPGSRRIHGICRNIA